MRPAKNRGRSGVKEGEQLATSLWLYAAKKKNKQKFLMQKRRKKCESKYIGQAGEITVLFTASLGEL